MGKYIAVIGSLDDQRQPSFEPPIVDAEDGKTSAKELGKRLAERGYTLIVYSSLAKFIDITAVEGYLSVKRKKSPIQVLIPRGDKAAAAFPSSHQQGLYEITEDHNDNWELSFYKSLTEVSGIILIGGGTSTRTAGFVALAARIPMVAVSAHGGAAMCVRNTIVPDKDLPDQNGFAAMGVNDVDKWIDSLEAQSIRKWRENLNRKQLRSAWLALALLIAWILTLPIGHLLVGKSVGGATSSRTCAEDFFIFLLFLAPLIAGASGATIRTLNAATAQVNMRTVVLGTAAAAIASLLYTVGQLLTSANPYMLTLLVFGVIVGFVAGFTFEAVLKKLESVDVINVTDVRKRIRN